MFNTHSGRQSCVICDNRSYGEYYKTLDDADQPHYGWSCGWCGCYYPVTSPEEIAQAEAWIAKAKRDRELALVALELKKSIAKMSP